MVGTETGNWKDLIKLNSNERRKEWKKISSIDAEVEDMEYYWDHEDQKFVYDRLIFLFFLIPNQKSSL